METETATQQKMDVQMFNYLKEITMETFSEKHRVFIVTFPKTEVSPMTKMIFARGATVGMILNNVYFLRPEFAKGGKHYNTFYEQETKSIAMTLGIEKVEVMPDLEHIQQFAERLGELLEISKSPEALKTIEDHKVITAEAEDLYIKIGNEGAKSVLTQIGHNIAAFQEEEKNNSINQAKMVTRLNDIVEELKATEDPRTMQDLFAESDDLLSELPPSEPVKAAKGMIEMFKVAYKKAATKKIADPVEDKKALSNHKKLVQILKDANDYLNAKNFKMAKAMFKQALEIDPNCNEAKEKLELIKRVP